MTLRRMAKGAAVPLDLGLVVVRAQRGGGFEHGVVLGARQQREPPVRLLVVWPSRCVRGDQRGGRFNVGCCQQQRDEEEQGLGDHIL